LGCLFGLHEGLEFQMQASEKEEFRNYLEKSGVIDALTKVLVGLYEEHEKPADALDWIKKHLGSVIGIDIDALKKENEELKRANTELVLKIDELTKRFSPPELQEEKKI